MKRKLRGLSAFLLLLFPFTTAIGQTGSLDVTKVHDYIEEVYADKVEALSYDKTENIEQFKTILKRIEIVERNHAHPTEMTMLSNVPLITTYNNELVRDIPFKLETFNPLKYKMDFFRVDTSVYYAIDGSNYVIVIKPDQINR